MSFDDPLDAAVDDRRIGVAVDRQPRRDRLDPLLGRAVVEDLRALADRARVQELRFAQPHRVGGPGDRVVQADAALAPAIETELDITVLVAPTLMSTPADKRALAKRVLSTEC